MQTSPDPATPSLKDAEKLLVAMRRNKASELIVAGEARPSFRVSGVWHSVGNRNLSAAEVRNLVGELLTPTDAKAAASGEDVLASYSLPGVGEFLIEASTRSGTPRFTASMS